MDEIELERRLGDAFERGERRERELRLAPEEADWVAQNWPAALSAQGGGWYHVQLQEVR